MRITKFENMGTLKQLRKELETAKKRLDVAKAGLIVAEFYNKKQDFTFQNPYYGTEKAVLFSRNNLFSCGRVSLTVKGLDHFLELYRAAKGEEIKELKPLRKALTIIEENDHFRNIANDSIIENI